MALLAALCSLAILGSVSAGIASTTTPEFTTCSNGPETRGCWSHGYNIDTDYDQQFPTTSRIVYYHLDLSNGTCNPDGAGEKLCLLVNGQYPGPTIRADWGDTVQVTVTNSMQNNGTSMHFHGLRQYHSNAEDGVNGVTECPLAPGDTKTYTFQATQHGTAWYHSHFSSQYGDGILGPIVFEGPATANYHTDLGPYMLTDWYYMTGFEANSIASHNLQTPTSLDAAPPFADNILINGTNKNANGGGEYNHVTIQQGYKYRLRLINMSVNQFFRVSLDNHVMQVITADFAPVRPYYTNSLLINVGQRYDVIIDANQPGGSHWFRATAVADCLSGFKGQGLAVWTYEVTEAATPTSLAYPEESGCIEPFALTPYWQQPVPSTTFADSMHELNVSITKQPVVPGEEAIFVWALGNTSLDLDWSRPTLSYVMENDTNYPETYRIIPTASEGGWNYWIIQQGATAAPIPHPIHLHGHDFFVLGQGAGTFDANAAAATLNWLAPVRRDTVTVQANGWVALAFRSDNPGVWIMHCHVAFHATEGLAVQFLESPSQINMPDAKAYQDTCDKWKTYAATALWAKDGSGI